MIKFSERLLRSHLESMFFWPCGHTSKHASKQASKTTIFFTGLFSTRKRIIRLLPWSGRIHHTEQSSAKWYLRHYYQKSLDTRFNLLFNDKLWSYQWWNGFKLFDECTDLSESSRTGETTIYLRKSLVSKYSKNRVAAKTISKLVIRRTGMVLISNSYLLISLSAIIGRSSR